jgi:hypothetical protein
VSPQDENQYLAVASRIRGDELFIRLFGLSGHSHLLPTRRWGDPHYAMFVFRSVPSLGRRGRPTPPPHTWGAFDAATESLQCFARVSVVSFTDEPLVVGAPAEGPSRTWEQVDATDAEVNRLMGTLVPLFVSPGWTAQAGSSDDRSALLSALQGSVTSSLLAWEKLLAPDFFAWLAGN